MAARLFSLSHSLLVSVVILGTAIGKVGVGVVGTVNPVDRPFVCPFYFPLPDNQNSGGG